MEIKLNLVREQLGYHHQWETIRKDIDSYIWGHIWSGVRTVVAHGVAIPIKHPMMHGTMDYLGHDVSS